MTTRLRQIQGTERHFGPWSEWQDVEDHGMDGCGDIDENEDSHPCIMEDGEPFWIFETLTHYWINKNFVILFHPDSYFSWREVLLDVEENKVRIRSCYK